MAKSTRRKTGDRVVTAAERGSKVQIDDGPIDVIEKDIARRAYDLYLARGCEPGHDLEDWLRAERELLQTCSTTPF